MKIDCEQAQQAFFDYVHAYNAYNPRIALKIDHSLRVAKLCRTIAQNEEYSEDDCNLAWLIGLLHDIGRFEQLRIWNTFSDAQSISHAELSVKVLFEQTINDATYNTEPNNTTNILEHNFSSNLPASQIRLRRFVNSTQEDDLIRCAIGYHSIFRLPDNLPERTHNFCSIVRDADKLDILDTVQNSTPETILNSTLEDLRDSPLSSAVIAAFNEKHCVRRQDRHYPADFVVGFLCFVFELEHDASILLALKSKSLLELAEHPFGMKEEFTNPATRQEFIRMKDELTAWLQYHQEKPTS